MLDVLVLSRRKLQHAYYVNCTKAMFCSIFLKLEVCAARNNLVSILNSPCKIFSINTSKPCSQNVSICLILYVTERRCVL